MTFVIVFLAKYLIVAPVLIAIGYTFVSPHWRVYLRHTLFTLALAAILGYAVSYLVQNPRPFVVQNVPPLVASNPTNGFPSDHTLLSASIAAALTPFNTSLAMALWVIALLVGLGRILALVHHPVDVLASLIIAAMSGFTVWYILLRRHLRHRRPTR